MTELCTPSTPPRTRASMMPSGRALRLMTFGAAAGVALITGTVGCAASDSDTTLSLAPVEPSAPGAQQSPSDPVTGVGGFGVLDAPGVGAIGDVRQLVEAEVQRVLTEDIGAQDVTSVTCLPGGEQLTCDATITGESYLVDVSINPDTGALNVGLPRRS